MARSGENFEVTAVLRSLGHRYAGPPPVTALDAVDLELRAGELTALLGVNGSGKSTLLRLLAGVLEPSDGRLDVLGFSDPATGGRRPPAGLRRRIAYLSQDPALDPEMLAGETLELLATLHGVPRTTRSERIADVAASFGLEDLLGRRIDALSGGQRRRLHLAAGLVHDPELLLLDEPAAGLDAPGTESLWRELVRRARDGRCVVIASHELASVERYTHRVVILDAGRVVADAAPRRLLEEVDAADLGEVFRRRTGRDPEELEKPASRRRRQR